MPRSELSFFPMQDALYQRHLLPDDTGTQTGWPLTFIGLESDLHIVRRAIYKGFVKTYGITKTVRYVI